MRAQITGLKQAQNNAKIDMTAVTAKVAGTTVTGTKAGGGAAGTVDLSGTLATGDSVVVGGKTYTFDAAAQSSEATKFKDLDDLVAKAAADDITITVASGKSDEVGKATVLGGDVDKANVGTSNYTIGGKAYTYNASSPDASGEWSDYLAKIHISHSTRPMFPSQFDA